jgi:hypothetical protein
MNAAIAEMRVAARHLVVTRIAPFKLVGHDERCVPPCSASHIDVHFTGPTSP